MLLVLQILETAFKKETVGLVTREEYVEKVRKENTKYKLVLIEAFGA